jgi:protein-L-isoaspartate(D-aspartate) O-methyltransferase
MDFQVLRKRMVEEQLIPRGIKDQRVLDVFYKVERHKFVPEVSQSSSYADYPLAIGEGQTISQPYIVALMTECLQLAGEEKVLEVGTGSGYQAAILAELAGEVYSIERFGTLANKAEDLLTSLGFTNVHIKVGDGTLGWPEESPFERIIITAASPMVPQPLLDQLKDGGKLLLPLGETYSQVLTLIEKKGDDFEYTDICPCVFVPLVGKYGWKGRDQ